MSRLLLLLIASVYTNITVASVDPIGEVYPVVKTEGDNFHVYFEKTYRALRLTDYLKREFNTKGELVLESYTERDSHPYSVNEYTCKKEPVEAKGVGEKYKRFIGDYDSIEHTSHFGDNCSVYLLFGSHNFEKQPPLLIHYYYKDVKRYPITLEPNEAIKRFVIAGEHAIFFVNSYKDKSIRFVWLDLKSGNQLKSEPTQVVDIERFYNRISNLISYGNKAYIAWSGKFADKKGTYLSSVDLIKANQTTQFISEPKPYLSLNHIENKALLASIKGGFYGEEAKVVTVPLILK